MITPHSPVAFVKSWRKREKVSQRGLAGALGIGWARVGDFERGASISLKFCVRFMAMLTDREKLLFIDVLAEHLAVYDSHEGRKNEESLKELRARRPIHNVTDDDIKMVRLKGFKVLGGAKLKEKSKERNRKRGK